MISFLFNIVETKKSLFLASFVFYIFSKNRKSSCGKKEKNRKCGMNFDKLDNKNQNKLNLTISKETFEIQSRS